MSMTAESFEKINYLLRPSKQVERKLLIETFYRLSQAGYPISEYTYIGLGSLYFADFLLFHKYAYIDNMICAEHSAKFARVNYNCPYSFIRMEQGDISLVLAGLRPDKRYIVWMDYDYTLRPSVLADIESCLPRVADGSLILVTIEAEPRLEDREKQNRLALEERERLIKENIAYCYRMYLDRDVENRDLARNSYPTLLARILRNHVNRCMRQLPDKRFVQLFNFRYADGAQMLTLGGLVGGPDDEKRLEASGLLDLDFVEQGEQPKMISVPLLTQKEKQCLDRLIGSGEKPDSQFALDPEDLSNYEKYYRYYPVYREDLL